MDSVDIIIPVYNTPGALLERCIKSAESSRGVLTNLIIINNNSKNKDTIDILHKYSNRDRISVLDCKERGASRARNKGIESSKSDYLFFLDSDDIIDPNLLKQLVELSRDNNCDVVKIPILRKYGNSLRKDRYPFNVGLLTKKQFINCLVNSNVLNTPCALYRTNFITENSIRFDACFSCAEDMLFNIELIKNNARIWFSDTEGYYYEKGNDKSATMSKNYKIQYRNILDVIKANELATKRLSLNDQEIALIRKKIIRNTDSYFKKIIKNNSLSTTKAILESLENDLTFKKFKMTVLKDLRKDNTIRKSILFGKHTNLKLVIMSFLYKGKKRIGRRQ